MVDVDVLVRPWHRSKVDELLRAAGYERLEAVGRPATDTEHYEWCYRRIGSIPIHLEVHAWFCYPREFNIDYEGVWARAETHVTPHRPVPTLCAEDSLLYVSLHEGGHSFHLDLRSSEDIRRIVEKWRPQWTVVVQRAKQWGMRSTLYASLTCAAHHRTDVPPDVLSQLRPRPLRLAALKWLVDLDGSGRARAARRSRWLQLLTKIVLVERPWNLTSSLAAYTWLRARDLVLARSVVHR